MQKKQNFRLKKVPTVKSDDELKIKFHEVSHIFPMMNAEEFEQLKADIEKNGLMEDIWLYQGKIIDGRNRYLACHATGVKPRFKKWKKNK